MCVSTKDNCENRGLTAYQLRHLAMIEWQGLRQETMNKRQAHINMSIRAKRFFLEYENAL